MKTFNSKSDVNEYLKECGMEQLNDGSFCRTGEYVLNHGEYSRPDYQARRYKDGWGIHANYYYYQGTFNIPEDGRVDISMYYEQDALCEQLVEEGIMDKEQLKRVEIEGM